MLEIKLDLDGLDYSSLIPLLVSLVTENEFQRIAAEFAVKQKLSGMNKEERNAFVCSFLQDNKNAVIKGLNTAANNKNIKGYICNFDADII